MLAIAETYVCTGFIENQIKRPIPHLILENINIMFFLMELYDLKEVQELAKQELLKHHIQKFDLSESK